LQVLREKRDKADEEMWHRELVKNVRSKLAKSNEEIAKRRDWEEEIARQLSVQKSGSIVCHSSVG
jgi:hypothetical protein